MSSIYDDLQGVAQNVLADFNQGVIEYVAVTPGNGPPDNPGPSQDALPVRVNGAVRGVSFKYIDGSNILASDLQVTIPAGIVTPNMKGFMRIDGVRYKIVRIDTKPAAGTPVAFLIIVRK
jgi:hypothetical protein